MHDQPESGSYHYFLNGEKTAVEEDWSIEPLPGGECLVRSSRRAGGIEISVEARRVADELLGCQVRWQSVNGPDLFAIYELRPDVLRVTVEGPGAECEELELPVGSPGQQPLLAPLMRVYAGPVIASLLARGGEGTVIVPDISNPGDPSTLLRPLVSVRSARLLLAETLRYEGREYRCQCCEYLGDPYSEGARFWLADDQRLVRYQWQQAPDKLWDVWVQRGD